MLDRSKKLKQKQSIYTKDVILVMAASFFFMFSVMFVTPLINGYAISLGASAVFAGVITGCIPYNHICGYRCHSGVWSPPWDRTAYRAA